MIQYTRFRLANGLRVIHNYDPSTAMVAVNTLYDVGSRDERPTLTGLAHLFEHLMFGGSAHIPDYDEEIERAGGINNAWTGNDFTNFYCLAPAVNVETLLWLESDRMLGLAFSPQSLEVQRSVVLEEFNQTHLNRPYGDLWHHLRPLVYRTHPYRTPTIGLEPGHIEAVTLDDVKEFFYSHYAPNNAVLSISGNITAEECRRLVEKWYGSIPRREIAPRTWEPEKPVEAPRRKVVYGHVPQALVVVAFPMGGYGSPDFIPGDLLTDILASGNSSRFVSRLLVDNPFLSQADASIEGSEEPGMLMLKARLADGMEHRADEAADLLARTAMECREVMSDTHPDGISPREIERVVNRYLSQAEFNALGCLGRAQALAMAEMHGEDINTLTARYRAVTPGDVAAAASRIFDPERRCTLIYLPDSAKPTI